MLSTLRSIIQTVNGAKGLQETFDIIVNETSRAMNTDICSVFVLEKDQQHNLLVASEGLNPKIIGKLKIPADKGLIGQIISREEPFKINEASDHEAFYKIPDSGEEGAHAFLGVPIIHHRKVLGVLVVQQKTHRIFTEEDEAFLITLSAQLAGIIASAEHRSLVVSKSRGRSQSQFESNSSAPGIAIGKCLVVSPTTSLRTTPDRNCKDAADEIKQLRKALSKSRKEIKGLAAGLAGSLAKQEIALFSAYEQMLSHNSLGRKIEGLIKKENLWSATALRRVIDDNVSRFIAMEDPYLKERANDILDLGRRVLKHLQQQDSKKPTFPMKTILVSEQVTSAMMAEIPRKRLAGIISLKGSYTSHAAILARSMGVPALMGIRDCPIDVIDGKALIIDGYRNILFVTPSRAIREEYKQRQIDEQHMLDDLQKKITRTTKTLDGHVVPLYVNSGMAVDFEQESEVPVDGVGLFRSEYLFMQAKHFPGEEEQRDYYQHILKTYRGKPVVIRTLDIGGDKSLPYFPIEEENPFLGWRGIRITLDHPEIFNTQIRAMLLANKGLGNLHITIPMVSTLSEVDKSLEHIYQVYNELKEEFNFTDKEFVLPKIGIVIEVPSALYQVRSIAKKVDFLTIGSNDLTQYMFAVDRNNTRVSYLYNALHPAVILAIMHICEAGKKEKVPVHICGEVAGNPLATIILLAMGVSALSMNYHSIPKVRKVIQKLTMSDATTILSKVLSFENSYEVIEYLTSVLKDKGLVDLINPGHK